MTRQSVEATYDSRETGERFYVTTQIGDRTVTFRRRVSDPFVRTTVTVSLWDALRALLRLRRVEVTVIVGGDPEVVDDVLELDFNTLTPGSSTRRAEFNRHLSDVMTMMTRDEPEQR